MVAVVRHIDHCLKNCAYHRADLTGHRLDFEYGSDARLRFQQEDMIVYCPHKFRNMSKSQADSATWRALPARHERRHLSKKSRC